MEILTLLLVIYGIKVMFEGINEKVGCGCLSFIIVLIIVAVLIASHLI